MSVVIDTEIRPIKTKPPESDDRMIKFVRDILDQAYNYNISSMSVSMTITEGDAKVYTTKDCWIEYGENPGT